MAPTTEEERQDGFRQSEISFLQQQNQELLSTLETVEKEKTDGFSLATDWEQRHKALDSEEEALRSRIQELDKTLHDEQMEASAKDEHLRVVQEQNEQMLTLLEKEETTMKKAKQQAAELTEHNERLAKIEQHFEEVQKGLEKAVADSKDSALKPHEQVRQARGLNDSLRADVANVEAQTQVDIEALEQALEVVNRKNVDYVQQIKRQESREVQLKGDIQELKNRADGLKNETHEMAQQLEGDSAERVAFESERGTLLQKIETAEAQVDALKGALHTAEKASEQLSDEQRRAAERYREIADKVYSLMDALRLSQVDFEES